jgi:energy-coupling factor transport system ATP-binding protein
MALDGGGGAPVLRFEGVGFRYGTSEIQALDGVTLEVREGEFVGLIGPTGAGKSTLCQMLNGIVPQFHGGAYRGRGTVAGHDTVDVPTAVIARSVGMVLEDPETQLTAVTVEAEVAFALENQAMPTPEIWARVGEALDLVGLSGLEKKHPAHLSGGQKQRLAIAAALALRPRIVVLDEPTSQLDPQAATDVFAILRRINREHGMTVVVASHAAEELAAFATRVVMLSEGRVVADGPPGEVFARVDFLAGRAVRPPDVTQTVAALAPRLAGAEADAAEQPPKGDGGDRTPPGALPVTLPDARRWAETRRAALAALPRPPEEAPAPHADAAPAMSVRGLGHVDLDVARGGFVGIVGPNGSGKSTLVKHFIKVLAPTRGHVEVDGADIAGLSVAGLAQRIGYVAQNAHQQLFCGSVREEVGFALRYRSRRQTLPQEEIDRKVDAALDAMDLRDVAERHPVALSRGDQLRTVIAAILALDPEILIFDEPTTGQDWRGALAILDVLRRLNGRGKTVVLITHHLYLLHGYVDRLVVMCEGGVRLDGPLRDVLYDEAALSAAGLAPPQTVQLARGLPWLEDLRPVNAADIREALASHGPAKGPSTGPSAGPETGEDAA